MLCTRCRIRTAVTDDGLCTFCSGTRPPLPDGLLPPVPGPGGWGVGTWPRSPVGLSRAVTALLGVVIAAVVFVIWFHRTRRNAEVFDAGVQRMGPGWAVGGWFVPVANFWFPYRVASGVWEASAQTRSDGWRTVPRTPLNLWWSAWVATLLFSRATGSLWERAGSPEEIARAASLVAASDTLDIVAAVLAILFVRVVTRMQVERAAHGVAPAPAAPGARR
ncbi:DUF4328 domain-containing protein [Streptomyces sp. SM11]|uniref:DUF4328 domain-containing protein n=1 Tax=Streptomyces sp. SM11 TaxID=565557 RepID=UPI000CD587FD|nr:DUF4328 domain-containing protein [Streptomyces sp. SM11]